MPLNPRLYLLPLALAGLTLAAGEDTEKAPVSKRCNTFGVSIQADLPLRDLKDDLDHRTGFSLGLQWTHDHGVHHASRTRFEWNTFPEGHPVGPLGTTTYAKNLTLSFDHLFRLNEGPAGMYLVGGLGGVRWSLDQKTPVQSTSLTTTKLAVTAGVGLQVSRQFTVEGRYVFSGIQKTFDSNTVQLSAGWRF